MIKALFFDIDGTLVSFKTHKVSDATIEALAKAKEKGIRIFIATGRPPAIIDNLGELQKRGLIDGYVTMNGAYCYVGDEVLYKDAIAPDEVEVVTSYCHQHNIPCIIVAEKHICVAQPNQLVEQIFHDFLHVDTHIPTLHNLNEIKDKEIFQLTPFISPEQQQELNLPNCEISRWFHLFADITAKGNTKQQGIDHILNYFSIPLEESMAFGDGGNDISMLGHAGIGVAMGNANEEVKASAKYVTTSVDEEGISHALHHFGII